MGERKVLNKYFPPDFDPKKVPRLKRDPFKQIGVRMMIPFSMQCNTCGEFMYRGKKFNSLKEDCIGEDYLDIKRFRFYIKCVICSQEITFKTDPEKGDYELETGASRNFESWTDKQATEEKHKKAREEEEKSDNMKQLENRTLDSKIEMEIMDALDEIKAVNRRHETVDTTEVLKASASRREKAAGGGLAGAGTAGVGGTIDEDEAVIANIEFGGPKVRRLSDGEDSDDHNPGGSNDFGDPSASKKGKSSLKNGKGKGAGQSSLSSGRSLGLGALEQAQPRSRTEAKDGIIGGGSRIPQLDMVPPQGEAIAGGGALGTGGTTNRSGSAPGSLLVSGIEAAARREAEKAKAAATGSMGTTIVVKRKKVDIGKDDGAEGAKKQKKKKHKRSKSTDRARSTSITIETSEEPSVGAAASGVATGLGGLLGFYDSSSSGSDDGNKR